MRAEITITGFILAACGAMLLSVPPLSAADVPAKAAVKAVPAAPALTAVDWSGFYLGGHVGAGWTASRGTYDDFGDIGAIDFTGDGFLGGAQAGYNLQFGRLIYGVEIDATWADLETSRVDREGDTQRMTTDLLASVRVRTGAAIDSAFVYGTIGGAYARSNFEVIEGGVLAEREIGGFGLVSGFGLEWALAPNWSLRGEYLYYRFDKHHHLRGFTADSFPTDFIKFDDVQVARLAANYRFGGGGQVMSAPAANWAGFYAGAHGGYGFSRLVGAYDEAGDHGAFDINPGGALGGGQIGYNWQNGAWVYGIEADASWSGMEDDRIDGEGDTQTLKTTILASIRGRAGIAADNRLYYLTGGWGVARSKLEVVEGGTAADVSLNAQGVVLGSGVDWAFAPNWSARLEGLTYLFDEQENMPALTVDSDPKDFVRQSTVKVIRVGLTYRFGGPH